MMMNNHHPAGGASDAAAALKGANLAFSKTKPKPIPPPKPTTATTTTNAVRGGNPSLAAASIADRSRSTSPIHHQHTGTSVATSSFGGGRDGTADMRDRLSSFLASSPSTSTASHLSPHTRLDPKSPSYIAAALAASRSASPTPQPPYASPSALTPAQLNQLQQMQQSARASGRRGRRGSSEEEEDSVSGRSGMPDTTSIPGTGHLISMFERDDNVDPVKRSGGDVPRANTKARGRPGLRSPTPEREMSPARAKAARMGIEEKEKPVIKPRPITPTPVEKKSEDVVTPRVKKPVPKPTKPRPITPAAVEPKNGDLGPPQVDKPAPKPAKPPLSPAKKPVHKRVESEQAPQTKKQDREGPALQPAPVISEKRSMKHLASVPITQTEVSQSKIPPAAPEPRRSRPKVQQAPSSPPVVRRVQTEVVSPQPKRPGSKAKIRPPTPPQPRGTASKARESEAPPLTKPKSMASVYGQAPLQEPFLPRPESEPRPSTSDTSSSNDTFVSASSGLTAVPDPIPIKQPSRQTHSSLSTPSRSSLNSSPTRNTPRRTPASSSTSLPLNSLSNAIMAGSLAATRLTPSNTGNSALSPPPLPNRTKSPRLRQTLRRPPSKSDDEDEIRKKKHQRASNKHSHAEGARKRWRDEITLRERRRYEAVWASNRGVLLPSFAPQAMQNGTSPPAADAVDCVVNIVAREIWRRSRLPQEELAEVWDLVDRGHRGMLNKQEFVVGMWLIDQRLRGRKIPTRVSASVWDSAQGVKVLSPKAKK
ncbi:Increased rDNA silencing protein 4 [Colletotrichum truncatum]|uniref:Increased rDNA silencing protein 4 n=1 Tax=Colletotrichum truncatum TaxID=5467 RepID=A0ACC3YH04_COLTU|nr:Increased rDNA silencing protein 4 [Colletotrichum truncatum]KAF6784116.1 Increased rDNA silencing protein 4 [Colletotrichum truncatum]